MPKKETAKKTPRKRGRPRKDTPKVPDNKEKKDFGPKILTLYLKEPGRTNVSIAAQVGCDESTVRHYLSPNGKYRRQVDEALKQYYNKTIFKLQNKAFKRLDQMLDDSNTPPQTVFSICKFLLEKYIIQSEDQQADVIEFETVISDSGTLSQIKRKIYDKKKESEESDNEKWEDISIDTDARETVQVRRQDD